MKWRRGFFRLWMAIAVLWVGGVGFTALGAYMNPSSYVGKQVFYLRPGNTAPEEFAPLSQVSKTAP